MTIPDNWLLWAVLFILIGLVAAVGKKASASEVKLKPEAGYSRPMIAFEMNAGAAPDLFKAWNEETKHRLRTALLWDYLFLFIYPAAIATACFIAARYLDNRGIVAFKYGLIIICLQLVAAMFDAVENYALLKVLQGPIESPWPQMARWCAIAKFSLIFIGGAYAIILGGGVWLITLIRKH